jgi:hypothetical protein
MHVEDACIKGMKPAATAIRRDGNNMRETNTEM